MKNIFHHLKSLNEQRRFFKEKAEQGQPLSILDDHVFKYTLASDTEDSREALRSLLSACIHREISSVEILNNELLPVYMGAKSPRLDVRVEFNDGEQADLEMQVRNTEDNLKDRASQYITLLQAGQVKRGKQYNETERVYQIFFLNFVLFPGSEKVPRRYGYREEKENDLLTDKTEIIFYELPKLEQRIIDYFEGKAGVELLPEDEKWCIFMKCRHEQEAKPLINELCSMEEGIMRAEKQVRKLSRSEKRYYTVEMDRLKDKVDLFSRQQFAHDKGLAEGRAEGLAEGREEGRQELLKEKLTIARNLLAEGSTPEFIQKITGLSLDEIAKL